MHQFDSIFKCACLNGARMSTSYDVLTSASPSAGHDGRFSDDMRPARLLMSRANDGARRAGEWHRRTVEAAPAAPERPLINQRW